MGNSRIQDATTGQIIGLHPGFIPLGMKERGGVLYIASMNKEGVGEIGSIPSPHITYSGFEDPYVQEATNGDRDIITDKLLSKGNATLEEEKYLNPGDPFIVQLDFEPDALKNISGFYNGKYTRKYYKVKLYAITHEYGETDLTGMLDLQKQQVLNVKGTSKSNYWFVTNEDPLQDTFQRMVEAKYCYFYPNLPKGKLCVKIVQEELETFDFGPLGNENGLHLPSVYLGDNRALVQMQSFLYESGCAFNIDVLRCKAYSSGKNKAATNLTPLEIYFRDEDVTDGQLGSYQVLQNNNYAYATLDKNTSRTPLYTDLQTAKVFYGTPTNPKIEYPAIFMYPFKDTSRQTPFEKFYEYDNALVFRDEKVCQVNDPENHDAIFTIDLQGEANQWVHIEVDAFDSFGSSNQDDWIQVGHLTALINPALAYESYEGDFQLNPSDWVNQYFDKNTNTENFELKLNAFVRDKENDDRYLKYDDQSKKYINDTEESEFDVINGVETPTIHVNPQYTVRQNNQGKCDPTSRKFLTISDDSGLWYNHSNFCSLKDLCNQFANETDPYIYSPFIRTTGSDTYKLNPKEMGDALKFAKAQAMYWEKWRTPYKKVVSDKGEYVTIQENAILDAVSKGLFATDIPMLSDANNRGTEEYSIDGFFYNEHIQTNKNYTTKFLRPPFHYPFENSQGKPKIPEIKNEWVLYNKETANVNGKGICYPDEITYLTQDPDIKVLPNHELEDMGKHSHNSYNYSKFGGTYQHANSYDYHVELASEMNNANLVGQVTSAMAGNFKQDIKNYEEDGYQLNLVTQYTPIRFKYPSKYLLAPDSIELYIRNNSLTETKLIMASKRIQQKASEFRARLLIQQYIDGVLTEMDSSKISKEVEGKFYELAKTDKLDTRQLYNSNIQDLVRSEYILKAQHKDSYMYNVDLAALNFIWSHIGLIDVEFKDRVKAIVIAAVVIAIIIATIVTCGVALTAAAGAAGTAAALETAASAMASAATATVTTSASAGVAAAASAAASSLAAAFSTASAVAIGSSISYSALAGIAAGIGIASAVTTATLINLGFNINDSILRNSSFNSTKLFKNSSELQQHFINTQNLLSILIIATFTKNPYFVLAGTFMAINVLQTITSPNVPTAFYNKANSGENKYFFGLGLNARLEVIKEKSHIEYDNRSKYILRPQYNFMTKDGEPAGYIGTTPSKTSIDYTKNYFQETKGDDIFANTYFNSGCIEIEGFKNTTFKQNGYVVNKTFTKPVNIQLTEGNYVLINNAKYYQQPREIPAQMLKSSMSGATIAVAGGYTGPITPLPNTNPAVMDVKAPSFIINNTEYEFGKYLKFIHVPAGQTVTISEIRMPADTRAVYFGIGLYKIDTFESQVIDLYFKTISANDPNAKTINDLQVISDVNGKLRAKVALPTVYCYYEKQGCMDTEYEGQWMPEYCYQYCAGTYILQDNTTAKIQDKIYKVRMLTA